jgi:hypothetical protein
VDGPDVHQIPFWVLQPDRTGWLVRKERLASLLANSH